MTASIRRESSSSAARALLYLGIAAGPLYVLLGVSQILLRPGFDITRHPLSMMANGDLGWIQVANFLLTAVLLMGGAVGLLQADGGRGFRASAILIFLYGLSLVGAGFFKADPGAGFPPGAPEVVTVSSHGLMHFVFGGLGFLALIAAAITRAVAYFRASRWHWGWFSAITGIAFFAAFVGIASGAGNAVTVLGFYGAVVLSFIWLTATFASAVNHPR